MLNTRQRPVAPFLARVRARLGERALALSGGGALGLFHLGVVSALLGADCLPTVSARTLSRAATCGDGSDSQLLTPPHQSEETPP